MTKQSLSKRALSLILLGAGITRFPWARRLVFKTCDARNLWGDAASRSGVGSNLEQTEKLRSWLPVIFKELKITSLVDVPCGDGYWIRRIDDLELDSYVGVDIVLEMIRELEENAPPRWSYACFDATDAVLPRADALLCRDLPSRSLRMLTDA